jgi:hypothetical protein
MMPVRALLSVATFVAALGGCGNSLSEPTPPLDASLPRSQATPTVTPEGSPVFNDALDAAPPPGCSTGGLSCYVDYDCADGGTTTLSGTVYDPAGVTPLYDAIVYIPNAAQPVLPTLVTGITSCAESCNPLGGGVGEYVAAAGTDIEGQFKLTNVPTGTGIPLVVELGKWRRLVRVDTTACANTVVPASLSRLPRNQSEGDIPQMAIVTGACDELACMMSDLGLDPGEFTGPAGGGRLHVYRGAGPGPDLDGGGAGPAGDCSGDACPLWASTTSLEAYDLVLLGCECGEHNETKPAAAIQAFHDWLGEGGRVLATHYQDTWFKSGPPDFQSIATWLPSETNGPTPGPFQVQTTLTSSVASTSAAVEALDEWLRDVGALDPDGGIPLPAADVSSSVTGVNDGGIAWIYDPTTTYPKELSFLTPIGGMIDADAGAPEAARQYCGRAMFTDVHAGGGGVPSTSPVPASCGSPASSSELQALEYLFFNLQQPCQLYNPTCECPPPPPPQPLN